MGSLDDIMVKSMGCFELLAFDFIINEKMNPYLLNIEQSPSLTVETDVQKNVHQEVVKDVIDSFCLLFYIFIDFRSCA